MKRLVDPSVVRVDFYGHQSDWIYDEISKYDLGKNVFLHDTVTRDRSINLQRNASDFVVTHMERSWWKRDIYWKDFWVFSLHKGLFCPLGIKGVLLTIFCFGARAGVKPYWSRGNFQLSARLLQRLPIIGVCAVSWRGWIRFSDILTSRWPKSLQLYGQICKR